MTPVLDRLGPLATTGIGSLPFARASVAARHAARAYDLPFCPQLPRADGDMVGEWLGGEPGHCGWSPDRDRERPAAWVPFREAIAGAPPAHRLVKLQVTGPVTLAIALERAARRRAPRPAAAGRPDPHPAGRPDPEPAGRPDPYAAGRPDPHPAGRPDPAALVPLAREVALWLAANTAPQVRDLQALGLDVLLVADEPGLAAAGLGADDVVVWDALQSTGAMAWGLHVCGPVPWALVEAAEPAVISYDLVRYGVDAPARACLARQLSRGRRVAWGVLDPVEPDGVAGTAARLAGAVASLATPHLPLARVAALSLATPACGTGRLSAAQERLVAATLAAAAATARAAVAAMAPGYQSV